MVKDLPSSEGDMGLIPGWGTKILYAVGQLSPSTTTRGHTTTEPHAPGPMLYDEKPARREAPV